MFSQASVSYSVHGGERWVGGYVQGVGTPGWVLTHWGGYPPRRIRGPGILQNTTDKRSANILVECFLLFHTFTDNTAIKVQLEMIQIT